MSTRRRAWPLALAALFLPALAAAAAAQSPATGSLEGTALDPFGAPLAEVRVVLTPETGGPGRETITESDGRFSIRLLPPGTYGVLLERLGFEPTRIESVAILAGRTAEIRVELEVVEGPVLAQRVLQSGGGIEAASLPGATQLFGRSIAGALPDRRQEAGELLRLSSFADEYLSAEGLPGRLGRLVVDGSPFLPVDHPDLDGTGSRLLLYPLAAPMQVELFPGRQDVQSPPAAGALLTIVTRPGGARFAGQGSGAWSSDRVGDRGLNQQGAWRGAFEMEGALLNDSARVRLFGSALSSDEPLLQWSDLARDGGAADFLRAEAGLGADDVARQVVPRSEALHLGGRFDWQFGPDRSVGLTALHAVARGEMTPRSVLGGMAPAAVDASDLFANIVSTSRLGERSGLELRASIGRSSREYTPARSFGGVASGPALILSDTRVQLGVDPAVPGRFERSDAGLSGAVHVETEAHLLQAGVGVGLSRHSREYGFGREGVYVFGGADELSSRRGTFFQAIGRQPLAEFGTRGAYGFAQDTWTAAPGLDVVTGLRYQLEWLPASEILPADEWRERTGMDNTSAPDRVSSVGLAVGFLWDVQQQKAWLVRGGVSVDHGEVPPELLAEAIMSDGRAEVLRAVGNLEGFPVGEEADRFRRLTILDGGLLPPLTTRGSLGIARALGSHTTLLISGVLRRTENLSSRTDLNRATVPLAVDQHGRSIFGVPRQLGGLVVPEPGTNRRFRDYDIVSGISSTATSDYWGVTAALERRSPGFSMVGSYTRSSTTDDWLGASAGPASLQMSPFSPGDAARDWERGTSDLDVPHRFALFGDLRVLRLPEIRLGGLLRYESGRPFTPGFPPGVDINGDGIAGNDPAFVDDTLEGMDALLRSWDCLRGDTGRFADRNACRTDDRASLDLRLEIGSPGPSGFGTSLVVEVLHVVSSGFGWHDTALLTVDREATGELDVADGQVEMPLIVNPGFGLELMESPRALQLRVGLQMRW